MILGRKDTCRQLFQGIRDAFNNSDPSDHIGDQHIVEIVIAPKPDLGRDFKYPVTIRAGDPSGILKHFRTALIKIWDEERHFSDVEDVLFLMDVHLSEMLQSYEFVRI